MIPLSVAFIRMLTALILGVALGAERSVSHKNAGMRTYALVALGSCLFVLVSISTIADVGLEYGVDPLRLAAGVVTGIGFLGAGLIFHNGEKLSGLTTAAGLWISCGIGIATGFGHYELAVMATALSLITFTILWFVEKEVVIVIDKKKTNLFGPKE